VRWPRRLRDLHRGEPALLADGAADDVRGEELGTNLPAQIDLYATDGDAYEFLFVAKGGGSANKTFLFQETKALLNPASLEKFMPRR
jgi:fumarate hydratase, class I